MKYAASLAALLSLAVSITAIPTTTSTVPAHSLIQRADGPAFSDKEGDYVAHWYDVYDAIWDAASHMGPQGGDFKHGYFTDVAASWTRGEVTVFVCDYGDGQHITAEQFARDMLKLLDPWFQGNGGKENLIRPAYFNHASWKQGVGFTKKGYSFC